jgi:hypothetical protein
VTLRSRPADVRGWRAAALIVALLSAACGREGYDVADLQLDVTDPLPDGAELLRVCVSDHGTLERGAGNGRVPFPGIREGEPVTITLDVYDADDVLIASAGPAALDADTPYATTPLLAPGEPCVANGAIAREGVASWLLALRFDE